MRRLPVLTILFASFLHCTSTPPPDPTPVPPPAPLATPPPAPEAVIGTVTVTASALNVRREAAVDAEVVEQVKKGTVLSVLKAEESWTKVQLASGEVGWVASRFVAQPQTKTAKKTAPKKKGCPADSDYAFVETPTPRFSDSGAHGVVVVEATVNTKGIVTSTKLLSNGTGDEALGFLAEKEIQSAKFSPPIRNCVPKAFIFTYRRTY